MAADPPAVPSPAPTALDFNKELLCGECGALIVANAAALLAAHFTPRPTIISATAVVGTLVGGSFFWLAVRLYDRSRRVGYARKEMTSDIGYFTPAAISLGLVVYDPSLYATSQYLLRRDSPVAWAVTAGQGIAFGLFLAAMNVYRVFLRRICGKRL